MDAIIKARGRPADLTNEGDRAVRIELPFWLWRRIYDQAQQDLEEGGAQGYFSGSVVGLVRKAVYDAYGRRDA